MSGASSAQEQNRELARTINEEARRDPESEYAGKFVGIAGGRVAVVAGTLDETARQLHSVAPDLSKCLCFEAGLDYDQVEAIWGASSCRGPSGH